MHAFALLLFQPTSPVSATIFLPKITHCLALPAPLEIETQALAQRRRRFVARPSPNPQSIGLTPSWPENVNCTKPFVLLSPPRGNSLKVWGKLMTSEYRQAAAGGKERHRSQRNQEKGRLQFDRSNFIVYCNAVESGVRKKALDLR